jgi:hypothetical protein
MYRGKDIGRIAISKTPIVGGILINVTGHKSYHIAGCSISKICVTALTLGPGEQAQKAQKRYKTQSKSGCNYFFHKFFKSSFEI